MVDYGDSDKYAVFLHLLTRPTCLMILCFLLCVVHVLLKS